MIRFARLASVLVLALAPAAAFAHWTGPFVGAQVGIDSVSADGISTEQGLSAGAIAGYKYQLMQHFTLGADAFWTWNQSKSHTITGTAVSVDTGSNVYGIDALAGFPLGLMGQWLPYVKVGYGWADPTGDLSQFIGTQDSWRYGAGIEWALHQQFSITFEYLYQDFGSGNASYTNQNFLVGAVWQF